MKTKTPEKVIRKTFEERKNDLDRELNFLLNKYSLKLWVAVEPANWLAKVLKKLVKISWKIIVIDASNQQK